METLRAAACGEPGLIKDGHQQPLSISTRCIVTLLFLGGDNTSIKPKQCRRTRQCAPQRASPARACGSENGSQYLAARCLGCQPPRHYLTPQAQRAYVSTKGSGTGNRGGRWFNTQPLAPGCLLKLAQVRTTFLPKKMHTILARSARRKATEPHSGWAPRPAPPISVCTTDIGLESIGATCSRLLCVFVPNDPLDRLTRVIGHQSSRRRNHIHPGSACWPRK